MAFIVVGIVVVLVLARPCSSSRPRVGARRHGPAQPRDASARRGRLVGRAAGRRRPAPSVEPSASPCPTPTTPRRWPAACPRAAAASRRYEPVDPEELGVTRRQFFNRGILTGLALGVGGFGAASLGVPLAVERRRHRRQGHRRHASTTSEGDRRQEPVLQRRRAKIYIQPYPKDDVTKAQEGLRTSDDPRRAWSRAYVALYQKCPHLGCRVPWCQTSQWFECPCHGSKYNRVGEKRGGPHPRHGPVRRSRSQAAEHHRRHRHRDPGSPDRHRHHRPGPRRRGVRVAST